MPPHLLSKTSFIKGLQCHKALYLYRNHYQLKDDIPKERQAVFNRGHEVGYLAWKLFPGGVDASPKKISGFSESVEKTRRFMNEGKEVIYEPAFQSEGVLVALDILTGPHYSREEASSCLPGEYRWTAYEVKSSARISSTYILDAALQFWVIRKAGIELSDFFIVNINTKYLRKGPLELEKLFSMTSVMKEISKKQPFIEENISVLKSILSKKTIPEIQVGKHCTVPYDCDFMGYCGADKINRAEHVPGENKKPSLNPEGIKKYLESLKYPLCFVDFEVMMPAVPLFDNTRPFQNIPFQYSIHKKHLPGGHLKEKGNDVEYFSFLAEHGTDPRKEFLERFLNDSRGDGSIIIFDPVLEKMILKALKKEFPHYSGEINQRLSRISDFFIPLKKQLLHHPEAGSNFSLKEIAGEILPENHFARLNISNGRLAMIAYENLFRETDMFRILETREDLEKYSRTDTYVMYKIVEMMEDSVL